jgi:predicted Zn-dependent protease
MNQSSSGMNQPQNGPNTQPLNLPPNMVDRVGADGLPTPPPAASMLGEEKKKNKDQAKQQNSKGELGTSAPDYFDLLKKFPNNTVVRWKNLPVRVHLPQNSPESWQRSLDVGIKRWGEYLPLKVVPISEPADIEVSWVNKLVPQYLGITRLTFKDGMQVQVFLLRPTFYLPEIPEKVLANVFLHELGHALGIFGHSDSHHDLMYAAEITPASKGKPAEIKFGGLGERDVNTLKHIYASDPPPERFSLPEPLEWGFEPSLESLHR